MSTHGLPMTESALHSYLDGQLPSARRRDVEQYLASNPDAAARLESWRQQGNAARSLLEPIAAEPVPLRLRVSRLDNGAGLRSAAFRKTLFGFIGGFSLGIALAGAIFLLLGGR